MPLAVAADGLGQRRLEGSIDVLGVDETDRQAAGQRVEEFLHRRRAAEGGRQQPDLLGWLTGRQRRASQRGGQFQAAGPLRLGQQRLQTRADGLGRIADRMAAPMAYVRKKPKGFGRNALIEGDVPEGKRTLLVEDLTETQQLEDRLVHSERLASIGRLAAGVAHEIGNPITGIACLAQNLREEREDDEELGELSTQILDQTKRISRIVQSLMSFAHSGSHQRSDDPVCLADVAQDAIGRISGDIDLSGTGNSVARMLATADGDAGLVGQQVGHVGGLGEFDLLAVDREVARLVLGDHDAVVALGVVIRGGTGADVLVTGNPGCLLQMRKHLGAAGVPQQLLHGGTPVAERERMVARFQAGEVPVFVNTGVRAENVATQLGIADGAVVGTYFKKDGLFANAAEKSRVEELMGAAREFRATLS